MGWDSQNNWPDIADLRIDEVATSSEFLVDTPLRLELYISGQDFDFENMRITVGFSRVTLKIQCEGVEIAVGDRFGDNTPSDVVKDIKSISSTNASLQGKASLDASFKQGLNCSASATIEAEKNTSVQSETSNQIIEKHVRALPNNKWEIKSLEKNKKLDAKYLTAETTLCKIRPNLSANRNSVNAYLYGNSRDLTFEFEQDYERLFSINNKQNNNKKRIIETLLSKEIKDEKDGNISKNIISLSLIKNLSNEA